jgi:tyrosyl-tRNA synthetase
MLLRWFQKAGNRPITLMGGGTTKVGDPSHRSDERPMLTNEAIQLNIDSLQGVFEKYIYYQSSSSGRHVAADEFYKLYPDAPFAQMRNNADWLDDLNYLEFLREIGRHFSVNRMLSFDSVKGRLQDQKSLSFLEFNYMILQAYDFLELFDQEDCVLQMGGSDQWGNIVNGIDLIRRTREREVYALTTPILTNSKGEKMGKSQIGGTVWLNAERTSPFQFWQYWRNVNDGDVKRFLKIFTELPVSVCDELTKHDGQALNEAKITLADEATKLCHGAEAAEAAREFAQKGDLMSSQDALPELKVVGDQPYKVIDLLKRAGLATSGKSAKQLISGGGVYLDGKRIEDPATIIDVKLNKDSVLGVGTSKRVRLTAKS